MKSWKIEVSLKDRNKKVKMTRTNEGFNVFELLGIVETIKEDLFKQVSGEIKPDIVRKHIDTE